MLKDVLAQLRWVSLEHFIEDFQTIPGECRVYGLFVAKEVEKGVK
jgi:hypothetical protein